MQRVIGLILFISLSSGFSASTDAKSSVWKVQKGDSTLYIGGTIHILRPADYPLPEQYDAAYQQAEVLVFETDMRALSSPKMMREMILQLSYSGDKTLQSEVSKETYQALESYAKSLGVSLNFMRKAKPGMMMSTFMIQELQKIGVSAEGIDMHFLKRAEQDKKSLDQFETPMQQVSFLAELGVGNEDEFYRTLLKDSAATQTIFLDMLKFWRSGNSEQLDLLVNKTMKTESPKMHQSLLVDRNLNWMPKIEAMSTTPEVEFILVGAAHLIGEQGVIEMLEAKGYNVSQM
jgi:uncharacterized protein